MTDNPDTPAQEIAGPRIVVVGIGGAGGNAVDNMIRAKLAGVEFLVTNTDSQAIEHSLCDRCIQLGRSITQGLGAGSRPDVGRAATEEALDEILSQIEGANMVFITAGMGGGTGTGGAPVIARAARESGILTVGVVTKPFQFEGARRMHLAEAGIDELAKHIDTLIVIPNQNLFRVANESTTFADAFKMADDVLHSGVRGVTDLMVMPGLINLDFADIRTVMAEMGKAIMGTGEADGANRAIEAAEAAISNPLLDEVSMRGAKGLLINITGGMDLTLFEVDQAANRVRDEVDPEANIIFGSTLDQALEGRMRVSVVATGIEADEMDQTKAAPLSLVVSRYVENHVAKRAAEEHAGRADQGNQKDEPDAAAPPLEPEIEPDLLLEVEPEEAGPADERPGAEIPSIVRPIEPAMPPAALPESPAPESPAPAQSVTEQPAPVLAVPADAPAMPDIQPVAQIGGDTETTAHLDETTPETTMPSELAPEPEPIATVALDSEVPTGVDEAAETEETAPKRPKKLKPLFGPKPAAKSDSPPKTAPKLKTEESESGAAPASPRPQGKRRHGIFAWMTGGGAASAEENFDKGDRYYYGQSVRKNLTLALRSYRKAADLGHAGAQNRIGWMFEKGEGIETDYTEAVKWYRRAAEQGHVNAMNDLGYMYRQGWGVPQTYSEALHWFRKAAERYDSYAEYNMGQMFENGWGVEKDMEEGIRWFRRSAARGHEWAAKRLEELGVKT